MDSTSTYPVYHTPNGTPIRAYVAEALGRLLSVDGGEGNYRGTHGVIGTYVTAEEAIAAARSTKNATCDVRVINTRAEEPEEVFYT